MQNSAKKGVPTYIIVLLIVFWPVGLFLLYRFLTNDRTNLMRNSNIMRNFGIGFVVFGGLALVSSLSSTSQAADDGTSSLIGLLVMSVLFVAGGVLMILQSNKIKAYAKKYKQYIDLVINHEIDGIPRIAEIIGKDQRTVQDDLQEMINKEFFPSAFIDLQNNRIAMPGRPVPTVNTRILKCQYCGATNVVDDNQLALCMYCRSGL